MHPNFHFSKHAKCDFVFSDLGKKNEIWYVNKDFKAKENELNRLLNTIEYMEIN